MTEREKNIRKSLGEHHTFITKEYSNRDFIGTFVQGSQNYLLDYEDSDVDTKSLVVPLMDEIVFAKPLLSTTKVMGNNEHCDIKDVRHFFKILKKSNVQFLEILFTDYSIIHSKYKALWNALTEKREDIARYNEWGVINLIYGMALEKRHSLEHPYPTIKEKIEKYGYDPKQLHHLFRLYLVLCEYLDGESFQKCLILPENERKALIDVKRGKYALFTAREMADDYLEQIKEMVDNYKRTHERKIDTKIDDFLNEICYEMVKKGIKDELFEERR